MDLGGPSTARHTPPTRQVDWVAPLGPFALLPKFESDTKLYSYFIFEVLQPTGVASVEIVHDNLLLTNRTASLQPPSVQFLSPTFGAVVTNDPVSVSWSASDLDGRPLSYWLEYSSDAGQSWETLALDLSVEQLGTPLTFLRASSNAFFRVTANDGLSQASAVTGPLRVPGHAPHVQIDAPADGDLIIGGGSVLLRASAWDLEDGDLPTTQFHWTDSNGGDLGSGNELVLDAGTLAEGLHDLKVTAVNPLGLQSSASVQVTIQHQPALSLTASLAGDQIELRWPIEAGDLVPWATLSVDSPNWFLVEGQPTEDGDELVLDVPILEQALYFRLAPP
jgi:hypothetical protein